MVCSYIQSPDPLKPIVYIRNYHFNQKIHRAKVKKFLVTFGCDQAGLAGYPRLRLDWIPAERKLWIPVGKFGSTTFCRQLKDRLTIKRPITKLTVNCGLFIYVLGFKSIATLEHFQTFLSF